MDLIQSNQIELIGVGCLGLVIISKYVSFTILIGAARFSNYLSSKRSSIFEFSKIIYWARPFEILKFNNEMFKILVFKIHLTVIDRKIH